MRLLGFMLAGAIVGLAWAGMKRLWRKPMPRYTCPKCGGHEVILTNPPKCSACYYERKEFVAVQDRHTDSHTNEKGPPSREP